MNFEVGNGRRKNGVIWVLRKIEEWYEKSEFVPIDVFERARNWGVKKVL